MTASRRTIQLETERHRQRILECNKRALELINENLKAAKKVKRFEAGAFLREARLKRGLSQRDVADVLEVTSMYISNFERGDAPIPTFFIDAFQEIFKLGPAFEKAVQRDRAVLRAARTNRAAEKGLRRKLRVIETIEGPVVTKFTSKSVIQKLKKKLKPKK